jgi:phage terminase Nu1 subunit (DNA packaging protein)
LLDADHIVSTSELARLTGRSPKQLGRLLALGLPYRERGAPGRPYRFDLAEAMAWLLEHAVEETLEKATDLDQAEADRRRKVADARLAEIKLAETLRGVVRVEDVARLWEARVAASRETLRPVASRLAPLLVGEDDQQAIEQLLEQELNRALLELAEWEPEEPVED